MIIYTLALSGNLNGATLSSGYTYICIETCIIECRARSLKLLFRGDHFMQSSESCELLYDFACLYGVYQDRYT